MEMTVRTGQGQEMLISGLSSFPKVDGGVPGAARFPPAGPFLGHVGPELCPHVGMNHG